MARWVLSSSLPGLVVASRTFSSKSSCSQDATGLGAEPGEPVSPRRVWGGGKQSKLPVALFSEEVLSVNRACGRVCPGQR